MTANKNQAAGKPAQDSEAALKDAQDKLASTEADLKKIEEVAKAAEDKAAAEAEARQAMQEELDALRKEKAEAEEQAIVQVQAQLETVMVRINKEHVLERGDEKVVRPLKRVFFSGGSLEADAIAEIPAADAAILIERGQAERV